MEKLRKRAFDGLIKEAFRWKIVLKKIIKSIKILPEDSNFEDIMEHIYFIYKVEKGLQQADKGQKIDHEEAQKKFLKWS